MNSPKDNKRKLTPKQKAIQSKSRDLIFNIFSQQGESNKLQFTKSKWPTQSKLQTDRAQRVDYTLQQPIKTILPVMKLIANKVDVSPCSFVVVDGATLQVVYKQQVVRFATAKLESSKLKYWLSHLYFYKFRSKLAQDLLQKSQSHPQTVHFLEQKEYLPGLLSGHTSAPLVRKLKISPEARYRRNGLAEKKPFCVIYGKNGREDILSFSQALAFADYKFNLLDLVYVRVLIEGDEKISPILVSCSQKSYKQSEKQLIRKFKNVLNHSKSWEHEKHAIQLLKIETTNSQDFRNYAKILTLQMIAYIQNQHSFVVKRLQTEWILDKDLNLNLSNVWTFDASQNKQNLLKQGLDTLYQKQLTQKTTPNKQKGSFVPQISHLKTLAKSEEKQRTNTKLQELPLLSAASRFEKSRHLEVKSIFKLKRKGKSCILRNGWKFQE